MGNSTSDWEETVNRPQRAEARKLALAKYPQQETPYVWGEGTELEHTVTNYVDHPSYAGEYLAQLKLVRAERFK